MVISSRPWMPFVKPSWSNVPTDLLETVPCCDQQERYGLITTESFFDTFSSAVGLFLGYGLKLMIKYSFQ